MKLTVQTLQSDIGVVADGHFGPASTAALFAKLSNLHAPPVSDGDLVAASIRLGAPVASIRGVRSVEAPRGPFDDQGRPTILFERHKFHGHTGGLYDHAAPDLSNAVGGGYGAFSAQYGKLARACALDPDAAFQSCSWGAFQVMGENALALGYPSAYDMAKTLTQSEAAHLDCFVRFIEHNDLVAKFRACRHGDPASCVPFVRAYNGPGYEANDYHRKLAAAI